MTQANAEAATGLRVAIFTDIGADSDKILSFYRAVVSMGQAPLAITHSDILQN